MEAPGIGLGATLTFVTSGVSLTVRKISDSGPTRDPKDTSHLGTTEAPAGDYGSRTFIPGKLVDPGELTLEVFYDSDVQLEMIEDAKEVVRITYALGDGESTASKDEGDALVTNVSYDIDPDELNVASITLKKSGVWNPTAAT